MKGVLARGKRKILLVAFVVEILKQHRVQQLEARLKVDSTWEDRDLVFTDLSGDTLTLVTWKSCFVRCS